MLTKLNSAATAMHQDCALQLLFNVRFLIGVLSSPKDMQVSGDLTTAFSGEWKLHVHWALLLVCECVKLTKEHTIH